MAAGDMIVLKRNVRMPTGSLVRPIIVSRFLTILVHLIFVIAIWMSRAANVLAGLPRRFTAEEYEAHDMEFSISLMLSLACIAVEFIFFFTGLTMFHLWTSCLSIVMHFIATLLMCYFVMEDVDSYYFWWIFGFGSLAPMIFDIFSIVFQFILFRDLVPKRIPEPFFIRLRNSVRDSWIVFQLIETRDDIRDWWREFLYNLAQPGPRYFDYH